MAANEQNLIAFAYLGASWVPCGRLTLVEEGTALLSSSFAYGLNYLLRPNALEVDPVSLGITRGPDVRGKQLLPVKNLPFFGGIRDAAPDAWGRRVIEAKLRVPANSLPESQYLLHAGSERVGALDIRPDLNSPPTNGAGDWHALPYLLEAAERIEEGQPVPASLEAIYLDGSALGGARPKASVRDEQGVLWLAKFPSPKDAFDVPSIEQAALRLAAEAGMTVPPVRIERVGRRRVMLIRRFDRYWADPNTALPKSVWAQEPGAGRLEHRAGFVSGLTLVACDETESRTKAYADLADAVRDHCHPSTVRQDNEELFRRMVYNILVSNDDDHLRNHGFIWDPLLPGWRLSPLYDVLPRASVASDRYLHLGVGPQGRSATLDNALAGHARFTVSQQRACELIDEVWRVVREWRVRFETYGVDAADIEKIALAFRHIDDVSTRELRRLLP